MFSIFSSAFSNLILEVNLLIAPAPYVIPAEKIGIFYDCMDMGFIKIQKENPKPPEEIPLEKFTFEKE